MRKTKGYNGALTRILHWSRCSRDSEPKKKITAGDAQDIGIHLVERVR